MRKSTLAVACLIALSVVIYCVVLTPRNPLPKVIHVKTTVSRFEGILAGIRCVESNGKAECFLAVTK